MPRQDIAHVKLWYDGEPLPPDARVIVHSGRMRYRTPHLTALLFRADRILDDIKEGDAVVVATPLSQRELRNPREDDIEVADRLVAHLNDHLEHYHQVDLDEPRRAAPVHAVGRRARARHGRSQHRQRVRQRAGRRRRQQPRAPARARSAARPDARAANGDGPRSTLLDAYATPPSPPLRISTPTRGVHAEAVAGACVACETIDDTRYWRWTTAILDTPPEIDAVSTASRASASPT